jgi:glycosyltransferase involved in cell wall biosynthesis
VVPEKPSTAIIIPVLNEADSLLAVLAEVPFASGEVEIVVVDGGSTDGTPSLAERAGAHVVHEPRRGYGRACAAGSAATEAEVLVYMDGDGSNVPADVVRLLEPIQKGEADVVIGARQTGDLSPGAMPPHQRFGNWLAAALIRGLYGHSVTDLGPFRAIRRETLAALDMHDMTYGWPTEMLVKAMRAGYRVREVPVAYRPRLGGVSKISGTLRGSVLAAWHILSTTLRYTWWTAP